MTGKFFQTLDRKEQHRIASTTEVLVTMLSDWAQQYRCIQLAHIPSVALLTSTVAPRMLPTEVLPTMKLSFWILGVDNLADERQLPLAELRRRMEQWYAAALHGTLDRRTMERPDELTSMLLEVRSELARQILFKPLYKRWALEVRRLVEAMLQEYHFGLEYQANGSRTLPGMDSYLLYSAASTGVPLWALSIWMVTHDMSLLQQLEPIYLATQHASAAVRLYNDLIAFEKEPYKNSINAILISQQQARRNALDETLTEARRAVQRLADLYRQRCRDLIQQIHTDSRVIEETLHRTVEFHADFYSAHDHRTPVTQPSARASGRPSQGGIANQR